MTHKSARRKKRYHGKRRKLAIGHNEEGNTWAWRMGDDIWCGSFTSEAEAFRDYVSHREQYQQAKFKAAKRRELLTVIK